MRHFKYVKAVYDCFGLKVNEDRLLAVFNLAKKTAESTSLAQLTYAGVKWSVRSGGDYLRVSLEYDNLTYSIYDGEQYELPSIEVII